MGRMPFKRTAMRRSRPRFRKLGRMRAVVRQVLSNPRTGGFLGQELKFYDTSLVAAALTAPADASGGEHDPSATIVLNSVVQGDGEQQRDGRRITMKSLYIFGFVNVPVQTGQSAADSGALIYIAIVLDTQTNGATITSKNVYTNKSANATLAANPMRNLQFSTRFKVLAKKTMAIGNMNMTNDTGATGGVIQSGSQRAFKFWVPLRNLKVLYTGTTETVANIADNSLHLIAYTSGTALAPTITYNARLRFMG